jgi:hypothetical protein
VFPRTMLHVLATAAVAAGSAGCLPLVLDDFQRTASAFNTFADEPSPAAGTYRVTYSFPDDDSTTVYARTGARPMAPLVVDHWVGGLRGARIVTVGYVLPVFLSSTIEGLPSSASVMDAWRAGSADGGVLAVRLDDVTQADTLTAGTLAVTPVAGRDPVMDRHLASLARWTEPFIPAEAVVGHAPQIAAPAHSQAGALTGQFQRDELGGLTLRQDAAPPGHAPFRYTAERISEVTVALVQPQGARPLAAFGLPPGQTHGHFRNARHVTVGYTTALLDLPVGAGIYGIRPEGVSPFFEFRFSSTPDPFYSRDEGLSQAAARGHELKDMVEAWVAIAGGITRTVSPDLALFGGVGVAWRNRSFRFYGEHSRWDPDGGGWEWGYGDYLVHDRSFVDFTPNAVGGAFIRVRGSWMAQIGGQSRPRGLILGLAYGLPYHYPAP